MRNASCPAPGEWDETDNNYDSELQVDSVGRGDSLFSGGLIVLVGRNNAGKSNIVEAIGYLLGTKHPSYIEFPETFYHDLSKPIVIEAHIERVTYTNGKQAGLSDAQCHGLVPTERNKEPKPGSGCIHIRLEVPPVSISEIAETTPDDGEEGEEAKAKRELHTDHRP